MAGKTYEPETAPHEISMTAIRLVLIDRRYAYDDSTHAQLGFGTLTFYQYVITNSLFSSECSVQGRRGKFGRFVSVPTEIAVGPGTTHLWLDSLGRVAAARRSI
jgi:hypothetical protein